MYRDKDYIEQEIDKFSKQEIQRLSGERKRDFIIHFKRKFLKTNRKNTFSVFEMLQDDFIGIDVYESWKWVKDYLTERILVLFGTIESENIYEIKDGTIFDQLYDNLPGIEFYITNSKYDFLIGYNHSNCLVAMGRAIEWLENDIRYKNYYGSRQL